MTYSKHTFIILLLTVTIIVVINLVLTSHLQNRDALYPPQPEVKYLAFGHKDTLADVFWIRALQDSTFCEQEPKGKSTNPSGARMGLNRTPECKLGWLYHMFNLVMDLAPRFHMAARTAPLTLSVIIDDIDGATLLFEKAMQNFPNDWPITYQAAYHYLIELENKEKAAPLFLKAAKLGAPGWLNLLAAKLYSQEDQLRLAETILKDYLKQVQDDPQLKKITEEKLAEVMRKKQEILKADSQKKEKER